jgi:hypothetical protein
MSYLYAKVSVVTKQKGNQQMCDSCENVFDSEEMSHTQIAGMALATIGGLIESYCEDGYCDPTMYKAVELAEHLAGLFGDEKLKDLFTTLKIFAGETVNSVIDKHNLPVGKDEWS